MRQQYKIYIGIVLSLLTVISSAEDVYGWHYDVSHKVIPKQNMKITAEEYANERVRERRLDGMLEEEAEKAHELFLKAEEERRSGKAANGKAVFAATDGFYYDSTIFPVMGGGEADSRHLFENESSINFNEGNSTANVHKGRFTGPYGSLAGEFVLAKHLRKGTTKKISNLPNVEKYEITVYNPLADEDTRVEMTLQFGASKEELLSVSSVRYKPDGTAYNRQEYEFVGGQLKNQHIVFEKATAKLYSGSWPGTLHSEMIFSNPKQVLITQEELSLGMSDQTTMLDKRLGEGKEHYYKWSGQLPDIKTLAEMQAAFHKRLESDDTQESDPASLSSKLPIVFWVSVIVVGVFCLFRVRKSKGQA